MEKKYNPISYKNALLYPILHEKGIKEINSLIKESQTRYSMSKNDEEYNNIAHWSFSIYDGKFLQIQCTNCSICGGYIKNSDMSKLPTKLLCNVLEHHDNATFSDRILVIKQYLSYFVQTKHVPYLYRASLWAIIANNPQLLIFYGIFIEYIGISYNAY